MPSSLKSKVFSGFFPFSDKLASLLQAEMLEMPFRPKEIVEKYLYKRKTSLTNQQCHSQCIFEEEGLCIFAVIDSGNCYLGNFPAANMTNTSEIIDANLTLWLVQGKH